MSLENLEKYRCPVLKLNQPDDSHKFRPLPQPTGAYPYHLILTDLLPLSERKMVFHMVGDTGSSRNPALQRKVVQKMTAQFADQQKHPDFLYHLGDLVYHHGEAAQYARQFFEPYELYPAPIFAIAGNHDSDVNPESSVPYESLDAFKAVFCDTEPREVPFSGGSGRSSMVQPNVYWVLETPLANIIGLHSNVTKFGVITPEQEDWFVEQLIAARKDSTKLLMVCIHHAPYSADINHGSSLAMISFLENAFQKSGVTPDAVFSGHVHCYQRFNKSYAGGKQVPFIVSGAGGFDELHPVAQTNDPRFSAKHPAFEGVTLENFCDDRHGFLRISLERIGQGIQLTGEYFSLTPGEDGPPVLEDTFALLI